MNITDAQAGYVGEVRRQLADAGFRVAADVRNEKVGYKIREAQLQKVPYMLVVGDKEIEAGAVAVRSRDKGDQGPRPVDAFLADARNELTAA